jgi:hypothetical protein
VVELIPYIRLAWLDGMQLVIWGGSICILAIAELRHAKEHLHADKDGKYKEHYLISANHKQYKE